MYSIDKLILEIIKLYKIKKVLHFTCHVPSMFYVLLNVLNVLFCICTIFIKIMMYHSKQHMSPPCDVPCNVELPHLVPTPTIVRYGLSLLSLSIVSQH